MFTSRLSKPHLNAGLCSPVCFNYLTVHIKRLVCFIRLTDFIISVYKLCSLWLLCQSKWQRELSGRSWMSLKKCIFILVYKSCHRQIKKNGKKKYAFSIIPLSSADVSASSVCKNDAKSDACDINFVLSLRVWEVLRSPASKIKSK